MTSRPPIDAMMNGMRTAHGSAYGSGMEFAADPTPRKNTESAKTSSLRAPKGRRHLCGLGCLVALPGIEPGFED